jgi:hypothetical protein
MKGQLVVKKIRVVYEPLGDGMSRAERKASGVIIGVLLAVLVGVAAWWAFWQ